MNNELFNRILTIIILLPLVLFATVYSGIYLIVLLIVFYFLSIYEIITNTKNIFFIFFASILLIFSFCSFYFLRGSSNYSLIILLWILTTTFLSDIGGYIFGRMLKGKKLTKISPNKTYSGAIGSLILSCMSLPLMNSLQVYFFNELIIIFLKFKFLVFSIFISLVCQIGDLIVSFLKRKINIKNISNLLPGHGGILDRIDGLIFVLIFSMLLKLFALI